MSGVGGFRPPWRRGRPTAAVEHVLPAVQRHIASFRPGPEAVRRARETVAERLPAVGVAPGSAFADAVLLVVSELVVNVLRHAPRSPVMDVGMTGAAGQLVVSVADAEPRLPDLSEAGMGAGLRMVAELAADYDDDVSAEPAVDHDGKVVLVRFSVPS
ncbi:ATP-binding protein [Streptomyces cylindrosporus]|uniref:ATP-binding protein n=1 Tax=Streptomyces cylindrosporus TaxID=2927583 RepID=A0ABS9Y8I5_9ACTN|nr:ATP-binding protein [Streptomyces cylindrosporus]MCI3273540.1 ATP-binding protein [Streptomyces cylindrosporus]